MMRKSIFTKIRFVAFLAFFASSSALGCIGRGEVDVSFKGKDSSAARNGTIVAVVKTKEGKSLEVQDDVGYVGMHLAIASLVGKSRRGDGNIDLEQNAKAIALIKSRALLLRKKLGGVRGSSAVIAEIESLNNLLSHSGKITGQALEQAEAAIDHALYKAGIDVNAKTRPADSKTWEPERKLKDIGLPQTGLTRSLGGCNADTSVKPDVRVDPNIDDGDSGTGHAGNAPS